MILFIFCEQILLYKSKPYHSSSDFPEKPSFCLIEYSFFADLFNEESLPSVIISTGHLCNFVVRYSVFVSCGSQQEGVIKFEGNSSDLNQIFCWNCTSDQFSAFGSFICRKVMLLKNSFFQSCSNGPKDEHFDYSGCIVEACGQKRTFVSYSNSSHHFSIDHTTGFSLFSSKFIHVSYIIVAKTITQNIVPYTSLLSFNPMNYRNVNATVWSPIFLLNKVKYAFSSESSAEISVFNATFAQNSFLDAFPKNQKFVLVDSVFLKTFSMKMVPTRCYFEYRVTKTKQTSYCTLSYYKTVHIPESIPSIAHTKKTGWIFVFAILFLSVLVSLLSYEFCALGPYKLCYTHPPKYE